MIVLQVMLTKLDVDVVVNCLYYLLSWYLGSVWAKCWVQSYLAHRRGGTDHPDPVPTQRNPTSLDKFVPRNLRSASRLAEKFS